MYCESAEATSMSTLAPVEMSIVLSLPKATIIDPVGAASENE